VSDDLVTYPNSIGSSYAPYFVGAAYARGGHVVGGGAVRNQRKPRYRSRVPTTVRSLLPRDRGWLRGFLQYEEQGGVPFDPARAGIFHHAFYVHARGVRKSTFPCRTVDTTTTPPTITEKLYDSSQPQHCASGDEPNRCSACRKRSLASAQLPGQRLMVSTWAVGIDNGTGAPELVGTTTLHEADTTESVARRSAAAWNADDPRRLAFEPNCKPDYTSIMSYLFQVVGQTDDTGREFFDYSRDANPAQHALNENALTSNFFPPLQPYRTAWFASVVPGSLPALLASSLAKKYCTGVPFPTPKPAGWVDMRRIDGRRRPSQSTGT
jgi:hypothetical protein